MVPPDGSIQREPLRVPAHIRRWVERLAVDRAIVVLARERWVPELRREGVIAEFAVAWQHFGAGVEPGAPCHIDSGVRSLLIGHVRTIASVIGTAAAVILLLGLRVGRRHGEADRDDGDRRKRHRKLVRSGEFRSREFPSHQVLMALADREGRFAGILALPGWPR